MEDDVYSPILQVRLSGSERHRGATPLLERPLPAWWGVPNPWLAFVGPSPGGFQQTKAEREAEVVANEEVDARWEIGVGHPFFERTDDPDKFWRRLVNLSRTTLQLAGVSEEDQSKCLLMSNVTSFEVGQSSRVDGQVSNAIDRFADAILLTRPRILVVLKKNLSSQLLSSFEQRHSAPANELESDPISIFSPRLWEVTVKNWAFHLMESGQHLSRLTEPQYLVYERDFPSRLITVSNLPLPDPLSDD